MSVSDIDALGDLLRGFRRVAVAISGGIDSLTLATIAGRSHDHVEMFHAVSPAVPPEATNRVLEFASRESWQVQVIDAAEFERQEYVLNPVDRCFYCKQSLYTAIAAIAGNTSTQIVSGTNADDLHEYRPGLDAARVLGVRHPFAELNVAKVGIRTMARILGLGEVAEIPSSPCLSSRVETGIGITSTLLRKVHAAESAVRARIRADSIRCRIRRTGVVIEIDALSAAKLTDVQKVELTSVVGSIFADRGVVPPLSFEPYRVGSAFLINGNA
ncbi:MAG: adenine nucleotide alpha hydrolase [Proteobacteria bacterium]|nr:adenine nucleotide alpha hydrolase [Pseudomonadota bacterium]